MTRMTGPDCVVMCNLINTHTHTQGKRESNAISVDRYIHKYVDMFLFSDKGGGM